MSEIENPKSKTENPLATIAGGVELEVTLVSGAKETVKVREIPITKFRDYALSVGARDEATQIALLCDKPKEWPDTLSRKSISNVLKLGRDLNIDFYEDWFGRQSEWTKLEMPAVGRGDDLQKKLAGMIAASRPSSSAPPSPTAITSPPNR